MKYRSFTNDHLQVINLVKNNNGCTISQIYWLMLGGRIRNDEMIECCNTTPDKAIKAKNVAARTSELVKMGRLVRRHQRYYLSVSEPLFKSKEKVEDLLKRSVCPASLMKKIMDGLE